MQNVYSIVALYIKMEGVHIMSCSLVRVEEIVLLLEMEIHRDDALLIEASGLEVCVALRANQRLKGCQISCAWVWLVCKQMRILCLFTVVYCLVRGRYSLFLDGRSSALWQGDISCYFSPVFVCLNSVTRLYSLLIFHGVTS